MNRRDAEKLIGSQVKAWTAMNGEYVGVLEEVFGSPWRARVRVSGVVKPACHFENGHVCRRGFRPGDTLEVGGVSIKPWEGAGTSYADALVAAIAQAQGWLARDPESRYAAVTRRTIEAYQAVLDMESVENDEVDAK